MTLFDLFKLTVFACSVSFDIHLIIPVKMYKMNVGLLLPREREGFTKAACYKEHYNLAP